MLGFDIEKHPQVVQDCISYMPQRFGLYEDLSVQENLDLYADLHGVPKMYVTKDLNVFGDNGSYSVYSTSSRTTFWWNEAKARIGMYSSSFPRVTVAR